MPTRPTTRPVGIGDELSAEVEGLGDGPDALVKVENYVLFVPGALPGERVRVRVASAGRKFGRADLVRVERPVPERVAPRCSHFGICGGCHLQHLEYAAQLRHKEQRLRRELAHALGVDDVPLRPLSAPPDPWQQRTKVVLHLEGGRHGRGGEHGRGRGGELRAGFFELRSHDLVEIGECPASDPRALALAGAAVEALRAAKVPGFEPHARGGLVRTVLARVAHRTGEAAVVLVATRAEMIERLQGVADRVRDAGATTVALNVNDGPLSRLLGRDTRLLRGRARIAEEIGGVRYLVSPAAFFQTSAFGVEAVVEKVVRLASVSARGRVLDVFCGAGLLALALARGAREVVGIEANPAAVRDAVAAARWNRLRNAHFLAGSAEARFAEAAGSGGLEVVVLDPPRGGCTPGLLARVAKAAPRRVVYVSCNPDTLGRDLAVLVGAGYGLRIVEPVDMFPHTWHVEAVAMMERVEGV